MRNNDIQMLGEAYLIVKENTRTASSTVSGSLSRDQLRIANKIEADSRFEYLAYLMSNVPENASDWSKNHAQRIAQTHLRSILTSYILFPQERQSLKSILPGNPPREEVESFFSFVDREIENIERENTQSYTRPSQPRGAPITRQREIRQSVDFDRIPDF